MTVERYFGLVEAGVLSEDDRVELLEGVVVAMTPSDPPHAAVVARATRALLRVVGDRASVRPQCTLVLGRYSAPEPDLALVPGSDWDYVSGQLRDRDREMDAARDRASRTRTRATTPCERASDGSGTLKRWPKTP